ncbi:sugar O-acetyltransferase, partial [Flavihumibacter sediminis]|nr:sugar O-acetyltransferase [Flavihumibacter sediminis]
MTPDNPNNIFERLSNGHSISPQDPDPHLLLQASYATRALLLKMNNSADPDEVRQLLSQITGVELDPSVAVFTPLY